MDKENYQHADVDGGYAWVILVAAFLCHGVGVGSSEIFGIVYVEILDDYQVGKYLTSWIITLQTAFWGLTGQYLKLQADYMQRCYYRANRHILKAKMP